ncbi:LPS export ABC transporter permease LptF [[Haemophilus] felis]|uniref:Lipopolysaccharide export system permease protein LptF n=1 Tax=[Haemophilus] felis TaxID=123822 RepID=A0A1T0B4U8_9PAST|nr:LPS export ABC transporter permease LptF [[Haemophilus] felis]NBI41105.1 LPS export ABC transporter permease LptF [[Haemophilus] felis]NBI42273.1 LPS export ABC transporter permease LptF [[Haemophilus] felis]OOS05213.1 LPS export ABC transporter permease LptF [[Haemophilus] felis]
MILIRYLLREIFKSQIAILFILLLIFFCQQLVRVLGSAASGKIPTDLVFSLLGLGIPMMAQLMLPLSLFIAILLTLGRLYSESEITVMRACGVGQKLLIITSLLLSLITATVATYNVFWLTPWAVQKQASILEDAKANPTMGALSSGQFIRTNNDEFVLFINEIKNERIQDIYVFQTREKGNVKPSVLVAEFGELKALENGDQILRLENSQRVEGSAALPDFRITHFDEYQAYLGYQPNSNASDEASALNFWELFQKDGAAIKAEINWRISLILAIPLMALIAIPLSKVNPRQGRFAKILPALLLYLIYFLLQSSLKSAWSAEKLDGTVLMPLTNVIFLVIGLLLNRFANTSLPRFRSLFNNNVVKG